MVHGVRLHVPAAGGVGRERRLARGRELDHDLVEAERVADPVADRLQDVVRLLGLGEARRHLEDALEHALVLDVVRGVLRDPQGERRVPRDRHESVELLVASAGARSRARRPRSLRSAGPWGRAVARTGRPRRSRRRAPRWPRCSARSSPRRGRPSRTRRPGRSTRPRRSKRSSSSGTQVSRGELLPDQLQHRLLRPDRGRGEHVVEGRPVDVHHHGSVAEQIGDGAADVLQDVLEILLVAHVGSALEHRAEAGDHGELAGTHHAASFVTRGLAEGGHSQFVSAEIAVN